MLVPGLIEHVERAGVHSGDSIGVYPPRRLSDGDRDLILDEPAARRAGAGRPRPAQRPVHRARRRRVPPGGQPAGQSDRAVPLQGHRRADGGARHPHRPGGHARSARLARRAAAAAALSRAVKAPVFSAAKLRGVDPTLGPAMRSTGEVIGIHQDPRVALAKALLAASLRPPLPGPDGALVLVSLADRDKPRLAELAAALSAAGYRFAATHGTAAALRAQGYAVREVGRLGEDGGRDPDMLAAITSGEVRFVVNTPSPEPGVVSDAAQHPPDHGGRGAPLLHHHRDGHRGRSLARSGRGGRLQRRAAARRVAGHDGEGGIRGGRRRARSRVTPNHPAEQLQSVLAGRQRHQQQGREALGSVRRPQRWMSSGGAAPRDHGRRPHATAGEPAVKRGDDMTSRAPSGFEAEVGLDGQRVPLPPSRRGNSPRFGPPRSTRGRPGSFSAFLPHRPAELDGCHRRSRRP